MHIHQTPPLLVLAPLTMSLCNCNFYSCQVSSNPPNLVTADYDSVNKKLSLSYTSVAKSADHSSAGVTIEVPQTQLEEVSVGEQVTATVLQGFGSQFKEASAGNQADLFLTVDSPTNFEIIAEDQATINAKVTGTPSTLQVDASSQSTVSIQGAITKAEAKDQATLSILSGSSFPTGKVVADDQSSVEVDPSVIGGCSGVLGVQDDDSQADCSETSGGEVPFVGEAAGTGTMQCMGAGAVDVESNTKSYLRQSK